MADEPSPDALQAWVTFLRCHRAVSDLLGRELLAGTGLPIAFYDALVQLSEADGHRLRMQDLARAMLVGKSNVTRLVDRMEAEGLVRREPCSTDRRVVYVVMTGAGRRRLVEAAPVHLAQVEEHFTGLLTAREIATLRDALGRVLEHVRPELAADCDEGPAR